MWLWCLLLLPSSCFIRDIVGNINLPQHCGSRPSLQKGLLSGPCILIREGKEDTTTPEHIIRSRHCRDVIGSSRLTSRLDSYDNHHRRKGEEDINKEDIKEQEPKDNKKTMTTTSTRISSIIHHIMTCTISHGSRATTTCLRVIDDIITSVLDYLDCSRSSNGKQQHINIKQKRRQTDDNYIKQNHWLSIKEPQHLHIKVQQDNNIKHLVGDNIYNHHISIDTDMSDISDTESTSSDLITLAEANIMSSDINMLAVSQPRLPTPTPFDVSSPPFQEWASELRTFLDINGFQYLVTRIAATSKSQFASDCNRNSKKSLRLRKHPLKPNLWTRKPPVLCGFYSVSEAPHGSGSPPEYVATTRV